MSDQYIVSARKYRPQTFDTVIGQAHITQTLKNAIKTRHLAHAYLFCGPRGVGKTTCARILARTINCESPTSDYEACGKCGTCQTFQENLSFNIFELDAASNNSVDDIRQLTEQVRYAPQHGKFKIYIIDEVHMLSQSAFNAFLKTLEEPPPYAIFILATTEKHKVLPTILSRCQIFDFKRIQTEDIVSHLSAICEKEEVTAENAALHMIAQKSEGCMRDALSMMDRITGFSGGVLRYEQVVEHLNILDAETYFKLGNHLLSKDHAGALLLLDELLQKGFEGDLILTGFAEHFRNLLLSKDGRMARLIDLPEGHKRSYFEYAQIIPESYLLTALSLLNDAEIQYKMALNKRLHLELSLIRLCYLNDMVSAAAGATEAEELKKKDRSERKKLEKEAVPQKSEKIARPAAETSSISDAASSPSKPEVEAPRPHSAAPRQEAVRDGQPSEAKLHPGVAAKRQSKPKLSRNLLADIQNRNANTDDADQCIPLNEDNAPKLFNDYIATLRTIPAELPAVAQWEVMTVKCISGNELQITCNSEINEAYARKKRAGFRSFCQEKTCNKNLRVTIVRDTTGRAVPPQNLIPTKSEVFDLMVTKNPNLLLLKNGLNLTIDY